MPNLPEYIIEDVTSYVNEVLERNKVISRKEFCDDDAYDRAKAAITAKNKATRILNNCLYTAIRLGKVGAVTGFLEFGLSPDIVDISPLKTPALVAAVRGQKTEIVKLLLEFGASVEATDNNGIDALTAANRLKNAGIIELLTKH